MVAGVLVDDLEPVDDRGVCYTGSGAQRLSPYPLDATYLELPPSKKIAMGSNIWELPGLPNRSP